MAELPNPIMTATQQNGSTNYIGRMGALATDVQVKAAHTTTNNTTTYRWQGSLQEYVNALDNFFQDARFMHYGDLNSGDSNLPNQVKFWYGDDNRVS